MSEGVAVAESGEQADAAMGTRGPTRVGLYFDLRNPVQWRQDPARTYSFMLEMCEEAEHLGADSVWFTEHHLFDDDYIAAPLTVAAAVAARTSRIRIGTAVVIAPLHHPVEVAEQAAAVDLISGGRLDLGIGTGYRIPEFGLYGKDPARRYAQTDAMAAELRRQWAPGGVTPRPVQDRLPIWMGYQGPKGARRAGLLGEGLLSADSRLWDYYREGLSAAGHDPSIARMAGGVQAWVAEDPEAEWPLVARHLAHQLDSYRKHMVEGTGVEPPRPVDPDKVRSRDPRGSLDYFFLDTPEGMADRLRGHIGAAPVTEVFLWASLAGMPEEVVARNVQTICTRLRPLLSVPVAGSASGQAEVVRRVPR
jgi:alkanesulfonate monooxygenase SsuD/methylene tetrahydromethanopterin reductase-like flavin-dependent oxidoreductase (luciferase family)